MASITPYRDGYRAHIERGGRRVAKVFRTKREAASWATATEAAIQAEASTPIAERKTLRTALLRYIEEVVPTLRGARQDENRLTAFMVRFPALADTSMASLKPEHFADMRDALGKTCKPNTVLRYLASLSAAIEHARREWRWITTNPVHDIRKPATPHHRERTLHVREIRKMLRAARYKPGRCQSVTEAVARAMLLALRTGMRAGEICAVKWADVRPDYIKLHTSKTGDARDVPLTRQAARVIEGMRGWDSDSVFALSPPTLDAIFRKLRKHAGLSGFTFHDTRHTAATMLAPRLDALTLCKVFGWRSTTRALTYYNPTASSIAARLNRRI